VTIRKRPREAETGLDDGNLALVGYYETQPYKKVKGVTSGGILEAVQSPSGTCHSAGTGIPKLTNQKSMAEGCREVLATPSAQGMSNWYFLGSGAQQEWTASPAQRQMPQVEDRIAGTWQGGGEAQQDAEIFGMEYNLHGEQAEDPLHQFPKDLDKGQRALLVATRADWERGTICQIKCRLCPGFVSQNWANFKRHCESVESHPRKISFCEKCGDHFARRDALARHRKNPPPKCLDMTPEKALEKQEVTERAHEKFSKRLEHCQETGEEIGKSFAEIVKELHPRSSKKRIKQEQHQLRRSGT
jgi:hypothetical protein